MRRTALLTVALAIAAGISGSATHARNGTGPAFATQDVSLILGNGNKLVPTGVEVPTVSGAPVIVLATAGRTSTGGVLNGALAVYDGAVQRSLLGANCCDPTGIAAGDVNGDGSPDVVLAAAGSGSTPPSFATWNTSAGSFVGGGGGTVGNQGDGSGKPALGDLNGDGANDLVVPVPGSGRLIILPGAGTAPSRVINTGGAQLLSVGSSPQAVAIADVNGDGHEDLLVAEHASGDVGVLLGNGDLTFQPAVQVPACAGPQDIAAADLNGDGLVDIAVACDSGSVAVLLGDGDGTFQAAIDYTTGIGTRALRIADMNNDGHPDIVAVSSADDMVWSLYNPGDGTFPAVFSTALATGAQPWALAVADLNGDGIEDVVVADHGTVAFTMLTQSSLPNVTFGATASATSSTVQAGASTVEANGTSTSTITVRLDDGSGNPVAGKAVVLAPSGGSSTVSTVNGTSDARGVATFTVSDSAAETVVYTARDAGDAVTVAQTASVTFVALAPPPEPTPTSAPAGSTPSVAIVPAAQPPQASFSTAPADPIAHEAVAFTGSAFDPAGNSIVSYGWDFGDGTFGTGSTTAHAYARPGSYQVAFRVTDSAGLAATVTNTVVVGAPPDVPPIPVIQLAKSGLLVRVDASRSHDPDGLIASYEWQFGDRHHASSKKAAHRYQRSGTYTVTLTVRDASDVAASASRRIAVTQATASIVVTESILAVDRPAAGTILVDEPVTVVDGPIVKKTPRRRGGRP